MNKTAADIRAALKRRYPSPEASIVFEVANSTGFDARRHLDAVAMELWPSRGLSINGIEIKVSIYDWRREKATPEKAEEVARFCDYFWIAAPKAIIPVDELPLAWGLIEVDDQGNSSVKKQAKQNDHVQQITKPFLAAMLRAASRTDADLVASMLAKEKALIEAKHTERVKQEAKHIADRNNEDAKKWQNLIEKLGIGDDIGNGLKYVYSDDVIKAINLVYKSGVTGSYGGLKGLLDTIESVRKKLLPIADELGVSIEPDEKTNKRKKKAHK